MAKLLSQSELWDAFPLVEPDLDDLDSMDNKKGSPMVKMVMELNWFEPREVDESSYIFHGLSVYVSRTLRKTLV